MSEELHNCDLCHGQHVESQMEVFELWETGTCKYLQFGHDCARTMYYNAAEAEILRSQLQQALGENDILKRGYSDLMDIIQEGGENHG
jgi:hypothetical protein